MRIVKTITALLLLALFMTFCVTLGNKPGQTRLPVMTGFADQGAFRLYSNEEPVLITTFDWKTEGSYRSGTTFTMAGQSVYSSLSIKADSAGQWTNIQGESSRGQLTILRDKNSARVINRGKTSERKLRPGIIPYVSANPALMSMVMRAYDQAKAGKQTVTIFHIPDEALETSIERLGPVEKSFKGQVLRLISYFCEDLDGESTIYADESGRIILWEIPHEYKTYVREGYEELLNFQKAEALLSNPQFEVRVEKNVPVPMRDGIGLATDLYFPKTEGRLPVILIRTPYSKEMVELKARFYARRGYIVAVQDCRGRFASPGVWEPYVNEAHDGYDAVEWLAIQPWASGKVGMIGGSYVGWVQWWAARERSPHLTTIIPNVAPPDPYFNVPYEYGCFGLWNLHWLDLVDMEATADLSGKMMRKINEERGWESLFRVLPVIDLDKKILGKEVGAWRKWISHPDLDSYWASTGFQNHLAEVKIPVFQQSGWFDGDGIGSKLSYLKMQSHGHANQKLILGPWGHTDTAACRFQGYDFGKKAFVDLHRDYLRWFDFWLKGINNGIDREPLVSLFVMGANEWVQGNSYPLAGTGMTKLYLSGPGQANASNGAKGLLSFEQPDVKAPADRYTYDPADPTPPAPRYRGKADSKRADILVYQTPPLKTPLTFVGPLSAVLYASSSAKDTDWFVRVCVVEPKGGIYVLTEGKIRARYRDSFEKPELLKPGEIYQYNLDLWQTGIQIPIGGRLRVEVASASFPDWSRNLNTGGHNETETEYVKAEQTIYHDAAHPSHILLPVIKLESK
ncbi:MAG: CocE/NonD family hydrolase [Desulfobacteraceae bacterium]|nr:MAG: CocE/NonD family hydrolase [Desulfobacteraceae bacterium]